MTVFCSIVSWFHLLRFRFLLGKSSGVAFAPVAMAPPGTGTGGGSSSAAASPSRTFRGEGTDYAAEERAEPVLSRGGRRRRETHKEGGERVPRGRVGGGGAAAWIGPGRGKGSKPAACDWRSASPSRCALRLAEPLGQARKWRRTPVGWEVSQRALPFVTARTEIAGQKRGDRMEQTL